VGAGGAGLRPHGVGPRQGRLVQIDPIKLMLKATGTKRLKLTYDKMLSNVAFKIDLRLYTKVKARSLAAMPRLMPKVGRLRSTLSNPRYKRLELSA
jgi:hypothetical protein